ncbi:uncharacterized protein DUF2783 [Roseateles depolymerans]|uniref:Uncharacterized protein n=1 Tax=Roseateles depolymerans TaxID=76731 RepID=A0A0U3N1D1_9BURK|nr:hypothetical protein RD2015_1542 [Roseateles depolymerans]REG11997.1 uncharacterized protein DUF2783 [Roseateles depolymerans]
MPLITAPHLDAPDDFYEALLAAHQGLSEADSHAFNARLILLLANHIGRLDVLRAALTAAGAEAAAAMPRASTTDAAWTSATVSTTTSATPATTRSATPLPTTSPQGLP